MLNIARVKRHPTRIVAAAGALVALILGPLAGSGSATTSRTFSLFPTLSTLSCVSVSGQAAPTAKGTVTAGGNNDTLTVQLSHFKPGLTFDMFTVERSNQLANGSANPQTGFGLAWYQSDIHVSSGGNGSATIHTILVNQIFGFDPDVSLAPTNTFNVGIWFNKPSDAAPCGFAGPPTPFNGEHSAGPVAFITRPNATTGLGPLCLKPNTSTSPATCDG